MLEFLQQSDVLEFFRSFGIRGLVVVGGLFLVAAALAAYLIYKSNQPTQRASKHGVAAGGDVSAGILGNVSKDGVVHDESKVAGGDFVEKNKTYNIANLNVIFPELVVSPRIQAADRLGLPESIFSDIFSAMAQQNLALVDELAKLELLEKTLPALTGDAPSVGNRSNEHMNLIQTKFDTANQHFSRQEFLRAHRDLDYVLDHSEELTAVERDEAVYKYLQSGLICYGIENRIERLTDVVDRISEGDFELDPNSVAAMANIVQEISTRSSDTDGLSQAIGVLEKFESSSNFNHEMANALGLAYRRLGERGDITQLNRASDLFQLTTELAGDDALVAADAYNNAAITHIRKYQLTSDPEFLEGAKRALDDALSIELDGSDYRSFMLCPKVYNNYGNYHKEMMGRSGELSHADAAKEKYEKTERWWTEKTAPYEWAMVRKNIAEVRLLAAQKNPSVEEFIAVMDECAKAVMYRTLTDSPFQWMKTTSIGLQAQLELLALEQPIRTEAQNWIAQADEYRSEWAGEAYETFWERVRKVQAAQTH
tara:strand:- start:208870 stop:210489 length:1620 start_codon:yes stop_codon:yes gene_type:complete